MVAIAVILGAHGVRGDVRVKSFAEVAEDAFVYGPLLDAHSERLITPKKARLAKDHFIVTPEEQRQKEDWDRLKGTLLHVPRVRLPKAEDGTFYIDDLVGLRVVGTDSAALGTVKAVHNFGAGDLIEVAPDQGGKPVLVPFTEDDVPDVDPDAGQIVVATFELWSDQTGVPDDA